MSEATESPSVNREEQPNNYETPARDYRSVGAKVLTVSNFNARHQSIVESSFEKSKKQGEKLPGKNGERRSYAYLSRLEKLVAKHGNAAEKRLWQESIQEDLLVQEEDISEATWAAKRQELRDNGKGDHELTEQEKHEYAENWRDLQKKSLQRWADYLGDEHSPYPLWFKIYAWDGMSKMGVYNKSKREYEKRNETTVAPYPEPDAEILGKMFELISRHYGDDQREIYDENGGRKVDLEKLIQSGNFAKIYNALQHEIAPIVEPPEKAEDVHGEWVEYKIGEEDKIARAAKGTGWCVASSAVGRHYLEHGTYGTENETDDSVRPEELKSRFILFHLEVPSTDKLSRNAVASIRLNPDGQVAEISGLRDGQALDDSLVQVVEEKVKTLPGGEAFLPKFADKNRLIRLDRKMKNGEDLTVEELEFLYEFQRPIQSLDSYNGHDPRIDELRKKYNLQYAIEAGIDAERMITYASPKIVAENLDYLDKCNAKVDVKKLVLFMDQDSIFENLDSLIRHGADPNFLVFRLDPRLISQKLDELVGYGADIDNIVSHLDPFHINKYHDALVGYGAKLQKDSRASGLWQKIISRFRK